MSAQSLVIGCSSTPAVVAGSFTAPTSSHGYIRVLLKAVGGTAYLGDSGVTTAGYPMSTADAPAMYVVAQGETLYVASSSGSSATLAVLRMGETT
jgi:hypothetical protein